MSVSSLRSLLYKVARALGDAQAVSKGKVGKRAARRGTGKLFGRMLGRLFK